MTNRKQLCMIFVAAAVATLVPASGFADTPGRHPRYMHARTDLRVAQWYLNVREEPNVTHHLRAAYDEVEKAILEIDRASVIDRKDIEDHPHPDAGLDRRGRFGKIVALLRSARADIGREEDNPGASRWRDAAFRHIDEALGHVKRAARDLHWDRELGF